MRILSAISYLPSLVTKDDYLRDAPVHLDCAICDTSDTDAAGLGLAKLHQHPFLEISYVIGGTGVLRIWNEPYPVRTGDLYVLNTAVPHGYFSLPGEEAPRIRSLYFDPGDLFGGEITEIGGELYLYGLFARNNFAVHLSLKTKQLDGIGQAFSELEEELHTGASGWQDAIRARITLLLLFLKRTADSDRTTSAFRGTDDAKLTAAAVRIVGERYTDPAFSLADAADTLFKSTSSLSRTFRAVTGEYFSDYLRSVRMKHAAELLLSTALSMEEIAPLCGYRDIPTFYRQFRQAFGSTPGAYRKTHSSVHVKNSNHNTQ
ncbi:MAG: helix-turn-helix transcriptional regulator, partial [Clostridia bacterium]|nr:helix-turn-helix transcriptional regulator [Clostridia bacterium]